MKLRTLLSLSSSRRPLADVLKTLLAVGVTLSFAFGATLVTAVVSAAPASAHAVLVKISPAANAQLTRAPTQVVVEFNEPVSTKFARVVVTTARGVSAMQGPPTVLGGTVTQALSPGLTPGEYRVAFGVTSSDGHPITGESKFTLTLASGTSPSSAAEATPASPSTATPSVPVTAAPSAENSPADRGGWLTRNLVPVSGALGLLVIGGGVLLWERRRR